MTVDYPPNFGIEHDIAYWRKCIDNAPSKSLALVAFGVMAGLKMALTDHKIGLTDMQRLAIVCGNADYADEQICPRCNGAGHVPEDH